MTNVVSLHRKPDGSRSVEETVRQVVKDSEDLEVVFVVGINTDGGIYCQSSDYSAYDVARFAQHINWLSGISYEDYLVSNDANENGELDNKPPTG